MLENVRPMDIERRSFEIITELLGDRQPAPEIAPVVKRVIHTTADFDYAENLVFSPGAVERGMEALRAGCDIVTDTQMARSGINKTILSRLGGQAHCFMSDADVAEEARERGVQIAMFGHTHRPVIDRSGPADLINPGSLSYPRQEGRKPSYMIMYMEEDGSVRYERHFVS